MEKVTLQDVLKVLGLLVVLTLAWARIDAKLEGLGDRVGRNEQALNGYMPRELQAAHDALVLQKLDTLTTEINRLATRIDRKP